MLIGNSFEYVLVCCHVSSRCGNFLSLAATTAAVASAIAL
jgi:hypothetical protein